MLAPSLLVLVAKVKALGIEELAPSWPPQQEIKVFLVLLPPNPFLLPFAFAVESSSPFSTSFIPTSLWAWCQLPRLPMKII